MILSENAFALSHKRTHRPTCCVFVCIPWIQKETLIWKMSSLTVNEQIYLEAKLHFFRLQCLLALHVWCYVLQVHLLKSGSPCTCWVSAPSLKWKWYYTPLLFSIHHFEIIRYLLHKYFFLQFFCLKNYYWSICLLFLFHFIFFPTTSFLCFFFLLFCSNQPFACYLWAFNHQTHTKQTGVFFS